MKRTSTSTYYAQVHGSVKKHKLSELESWSRAIVYIGSSTMIVGTHNSLWAVFPKEAWRSYNWTEGMDSDRFNLRLDSIDQVRANTRCSLSICSPQPNSVVVPTKTTKMTNISKNMDLTIKPIPARSPILPHSVVYLGGIVDISRPTFALLKNNVQILIEGPALNPDATDRPSYTEMDFTKLNMEYQRCLSIIVPYWYLLLAVVEHWVCSFRRISSHLSNLGLQTWLIWHKMAMETIISFRNK